MVRPRGDSGRSGSDGSGHGERSQCRKGFGANARFSKALDAEQRREGGKSDSWLWGCRNGVAGGVLAGTGQLGTQVAGERRSQSDLDRLSLSFLLYVHVEVRGGQLDMSVERNISFGSVSL